MWRLLVVSCSMVVAVTSQFACENMSAKDILQCDEVNKIWSWFPEGFVKNYLTRRKCTSRDYAGRCGWCESSSKCVPSSAIQNCREDLLSCLPSVLSCPSQEALQFCPSLNDEVTCESGTIISHPENPIILKPDDCAWCPQNGCVPLGGNDFARKFVCSNEGNNFIDNCVTSNPQPDEQCFLIPDALTWAGAREKCTETFGGFLAIPDTVAKLNHLKQIPDWWHAWVGLYQPERDSEWLWINSQRLETTSPLWAPGEPNDNAIIEGNTEDCGEIYYNRGRLNDMDCSVMQPSICCVSSSDPTPPPTFGEFESSESEPEVCTVSTNSQTWSEANNACVAKGTRYRLLEIHSYVVLDSIAKLMFDENLSEAWTGAYEPNNQNDWQWTNADASTAFLQSPNIWWPGEPNNHNNDENCATIKTVRRSGSRSDLMARLNDGNCGWRRHSICCQY